LRRRTASRVSRGRPVFGGFVSRNASPSCATKALGRSGKSPEHADWTRARLGRLLETACRVISKARGSGAHVHRLSRSGFGRRRFVHRAAFRRHKGGSSSAKDGAAPTSKITADFIYGPICGACARLNEPGGISPDALDAWAHRLRKSIAQGPPGDCL